MNVTFEKIDNVNGRLTVTVAESDYAKQRDQEIKRLQTSHPLRGFRPGKAPKDAALKIFGPQVMSKVVDRLVTQAMNEYIRDNNLNLFGYPMLRDDTNVNLLAGGDFEFVFDLGLRPELPLTIDENIHLPYYDIAVTDEMVAERCKQYRKEFSRLVPGEVAADDSLIHGSIAELNPDGTQKEGGITTERSVVAPRYLADEQQKSIFVGAKVGDDLVFNPHKATAGNDRDIAYMLGIDKEGADRITADFRFTVTEVMVHQDSPLDQEFFDQVLGKDVATDEAQFNEKLREIIASQYANDTNYRFSIDARKALTEQADGIELPDEFLIRYFASRDNDRTEDQLRNDYPAIRKDLVWTLISDNVEHQFAIEVTDDDMMRYARFAAARQLAQYGLMNAPEDAVEDMAKRILQNENIAERIHAEALTDKVYAAIRDHVTLDRQTITLEAFTNLFKNETPAEETAAEAEQAVEAVEKADNGQQQ